MNRTITIAVALSGALALALAVSPAALVLVPLALLAVAVAGRRHDRPIAPDGAPAERERAHILCGIGSLALAGAILLVDGGELSEPVWAIWALSIVAGTVLLVFGLVRRYAPHARRSVA